MAAFVSLSSSHPHSQECQRSSRDFLRTVPHCEQTCEVERGFTNNTARPAYAALLTVSRSYDKSAITPIV